MQLSKHDYRALTLRDLRCLRILYGLFLASLVLSLVSWSARPTHERKTRVFLVYNGKKQIGNLTLTETRNALETHILVRSEIETQLLFTFKASGSESYQYRNDTLISSELFRKVNNRVSLNQRLVKKGLGYEIFRPDQYKTLEVGNIQINLTRLFLQEPKGTTRVFSDRFTQWVPLTQTGPHRYEVALPNGSRTIFSYRDGQCHNVLSIGTFYKVQLIPQP